MKLKRCISSAAAGLLLSGGMSVSLADEAPVVSPGGVLEEIVVTATRRDTSVQETNFNLTAVSGSQLEQQRIIDTIAFAKTVPGLTAVDQGNRRGSQMIMRGANLTSINSTDLIERNGDTVSTFYGETPVYIDPLITDFDRIEVLRGPQGTLFGARSLGGAVRYMPAAPDTQNFFVDVHGRGYAIDESSGGGLLGDITVNAPIIEDVLAFRGTLAYLKEDGFIDYNYLLKEPGVSDAEDPNDLRSEKDANTQDVSMIRLALQWNISENWSSTLAWTHQNRDVGGRQVNNVDSYQTGKYESAYRYVEPNERKNDIVNLTFNGDLGFGDFISTTSYSKYDEKGQRDQTDWWLENANNDFFPIFGSDIETWDAISSYTAEEVDEKTITQEFRLASKADARLQWLGGIFYNKRENDNQTTEYLPGLSEWWNTNIADEFETGDLADIGYFSPSTSTFTEKALFGQIGYNFTEQWQATVGGRYFKTDLDVTICRWFEPIKGDTALGGSFYECDQGGGKTDEAIFMFNTSYDINETKKIYFTISEGFGDGGENPNAVCGDNPTPNCIAGNEKEVKPDTVTNYEFGVRTMMLDNKMTLNAALYRMNWDNIQTQGESTESPVVITRNGGKARTEGLELELNYFLGDYWVIGGGYAYTDAEFRENLDVGEVYAFDVIEKGDRLPGSSEHQGNLFLAVDYPLSGNLRLKADYLLTAQSDVLTKAGIGVNDCCREDGEKLSGFTVSNLGVGLAGNSWEARLFADNLFNEYAETGLRGDQYYIQGNGLGIENTWTGNEKIIRRYYKNMIRPRTIGLDVNFRFGDK